MSDLCAIEADYVNWRPVNGRKVLQLVFEVPLESTHDVLTKLGTPTPGESKWVAIALLNLKPARVAQEDRATALLAGDVGSNPTGVAKKWAEYKPSQQAAILCADPAFQNYFIGPIGGEDDCVEAVKAHLRIKSRKELDSDPKAEARWSEFYALYQLHRERHK